MFALDVSVLLPMSVRCFPGASGGRSLHLACFAASQETTGLSRRVAGGEALSVCQSLRELLTCGLSQ